MEFGFCYIPDYHEELHGDFREWYARLMREWVLADELGYDAVWIAEHRYPGYGFSSTPVVAQAISERTSRIAVGTAVTLLSQRHPVLTAEDWAAVDLLSGGRLRFGIGRGIFGYDFDIVGVPSSESRPRFEEAWEVIRRLWTEDAVAHEGKFWPFPEHRLRPQPLQKPMPPVYVGCVASPDSYVWAGRNGCNVVVSPFLLDSTQRQRDYLELYRESLAEAGHDPAGFRVLANYHLALVERESELEGVDQHFYNYFSFLHRSSRSGNKLDEQAYASYAPGAGIYGAISEMRETRAVIGTPQQCIDRIGELAEACHLDGWMFHINYGGVPHERVTEQMRLLKECVVPVFRGK
jgi:alkanesulfonate monooxygenase SsuD/methylene tetrahydromethanopterin reductase-like flavin-dependent oxidoreductase (luciferase family)